MMLNFVNEKSNPSNICFTMYMYYRGVTLRLSGKPSLLAMVKKD